MRTLKHLGVALVAASSLIPSAAFAAQDPAPTPPATAQAPATAQPATPTAPAQPATPTAPAQPATQPAAPAAPAAQPAPAADPTPPAAPAAPEPKANEPGGPGVSLSLTTETPAKDTVSGESDKKKDEKKLAWRGSTLMFDQNMSSQTTHLDPATQQTYVGSYEWWISFRPRYYFTEKLNFNMRFDYYKDLTNAENTTYKHEDVFGDIWANLVYALPKLSKNTEERVGLRTLLPASKESQAQGIYITAGATGSISQDVPIRGEEAKYLNSAKFALSAAYTHPFSQSTSPANYGNFTYERQDLDGRATSSSLVSPGNLTNHQVLALIDAELAITPKLLFTLDFITINQWKYLPKGDISTNINGVVTPVPRSANATSFKQQVWFIASVGYDVVDEINLSLGYYNLTNELAADGTRRGVIGANTVWWSPDARVFFDVTANLDKAYLWATGQKESQKKAAAFNASRNRLNREVMHTTGTTIQE